MEVFGSFEATEVAREGNFGVIMYARRAGSDKRYAIKVFRPPEFLMDDAQIDQEAQFFLESAQAQQNAAAALPSSWAPVYEMGRCQGGAWYATDLMECSLEWLRITQKDLEPEHIRKVMEPVVQGLAVLKQSQGRAHGNLKATNVLVQGRSDLVRARIVLSDPKPGSRCKSPEDDQADVRDVGNLVHQLILHRQFQNATEWPLQSTDQWKRLGKAGAAWLELVNKLIDPTTTRKPSIQDVLASLPGGPSSIPAGIKSPAQAETERKAREEKAREEEDRRKQKEAEIARKVREQAEKDAQAKAAAEAKAREDAARKAEADRKAKEEADRKAKEDAERRAREAEAKRKADEESARRAKEEEEKRKVEQERRDAETKAQDAERKARDDERRKQEEARKQEEEAARREKEEADKKARAAEAERVAKQKAEEKARQDAAREAEAKRKAEEQARKAEEEAARRKAAEEAAKAKAEAKAAADAARKAEREQAASDRAAAAASASAAISETAPTDAAPASPTAKGGGSKKLVLAGAAVVVIGGAIGGIMMFGGGEKKSPPPVPPDPTPGKITSNSPPTPAPVPDPTPNPAPSPDPTKDRPAPTPPTPQVPTAQEIASAAGTLLTSLESRVVDAVGALATSEAARLKGSAAPAVSTAAARDAEKVATAAPLTASETQVRSDAQKAAEAAVRRDLSAAMTAPPAPTPEKVDSLKALATEMDASLRSKLTGADASQVTKTSADAIRDAAAKHWPKAFQTAGEEAVNAGVKDLAGPAADAAVEAFKKRVLAQKPPTPPPPDITDADLQAVRDAAKAVAAMLDSGAAADDSGASARAALAKLPAMKGYDRVSREPDVDRVVTRVGAVERISKTPAAGVMQEITAAQGPQGGASELISAWNRLGAVAAPVDLAELAKARDAAIARINAFDPGVQAKATKAIDIATRTLWDAKAAAAADEASLGSAKAGLEALKIPAESISPELQFNFALLDFKQAVRGSTGSAQERAAALKDPSGKFVQKVQGLAPIADQASVKQALQAAQSVLNPPASPPQGGDPSKAGPGAVGWQAEVADGGDKVTYTLPAVGTRLREEKLTFYKVGNSYLCATEISISLFRRLFSDATGLDEIRGAYSDPQNGMKLWRAASKAVELNTQLAKTPDIATPAQLEEWSGRPPRDINPQLTWPVEYINPKAAAVVAGKLGCRLPTIDEWRTAAQLEQGASKNLRDATWFAVLAQSKQFKYNGAPVSPDGESVVRERPIVENPTPDDGFPFFAPVDAQGFGQKWKHLQGNVAEWVFAAPPQGPEPIAANLAAVNAAWTYAVVGGSAVSPPGISQTDQAVSEHNSKPWFDVGVRPAFTAPGGQTAAAPSIDSAVSQVAALQFLPPRSR